MVCVRVLGSSDETTWTKWLGSPKQNKKWQSTTIIIIELTARERNTRGRHNNNKSNGYLIFDATFVLAREEKERERGYECRMCIITPIMIMVMVIECV